MRTDDELSDHAELMVQQGRRLRLMRWLIALSFVLILVVLLLASL